MNLSLALEYVERFPVDAAVARCLAALFPSAPRDNEEDLYHTKLYVPEDVSGMGLFFARHPAKAEELEEVARQNGIDISNLVQLMAPWRETG
jgi:hypothetical protein